jgi:hypothetical protein
MTKEIKIKITGVREIIVFLGDKFQRFFSWCFLHLKNAVGIFFNDIKNKKWRGLIVLALAVGAYFLWGISSALLWLLFLLFLVYEWENRIIASLALICLASCPFLLSFNNNTLAETMAVYAFFFLVMTVALQIIEYKRHPERFPDEDKGN